MKAGYFKKYGSVDVLEVGDLPIPEPREGWVRVKVSYCALNRLDLFVRSGIPGLHLELPHIGGSDFSGVIDAIGDNVTGWNVGDKVVANPGIGCGECWYCKQGEESLCKKYKIIGEHLPGACAEYVVVPARNLYRVPEGYDMQKAAAAPLTALTAWRQVVTQGQVKPGQTVLVIGAGSGVSIMAIQIAKFAGATVIATTSSSEKEKKAKELGADHVINYVEHPDWEKEVYSYTHKQGVDLVIDNMGEATIPKSLRAVRKGGRVVYVGATTGPFPKIDLRLLFWKQVHLIGSTMSNQIEFEYAMNAVFSERVVPVVDSVFSLDEIKKAHEYMESNKQFGKIVIKINED